MADATFVKVLDTADELPVELGSLCFIEARISDNEVKKLTSVGVFHDHEQFLLSLNDLVELNYIGMTNLLQNFDLSSDALHIFLVIDLFFLKNFYSHFLACQNVRALLDLAECTLSQRLA